MNAQQLARILQINAQGQTAPAWIKEATLIVCPSKYGNEYQTTRAEFFTELTVRIPTAKKSKRTGKMYHTSQRRRVDLAAIVQPHFKQYEPFAVGVEIKVDYHDLANDQKIGDYLRFFHLFYLAVPADEEIIGLARERAEALKIGLLIAHENGSVDVDAHTKEAFIPMNVDLRKLYAEMLIRPFKTARREEIAA